MKQEIIKNNRGITVIALAITVIVLLILAGITLSLILGQRGIFYMAKKAGENYIKAENSEQQEILELTNEMYNKILETSPTYCKTTLCEGPFTNVTICEECSRRR